MAADRKVKYRPNKKRNIEDIRICIFFEQIARYHQCYKYRHMRVIIACYSVVLSAEELQLCALHPRYL